MVNRVGVVGMKQKLCAILGGVLFAVFFPGAWAGGGDPHRMPPDFVDLHAIDPSIAIDIGYSGSLNFVGRPIPGYGVNRCLLTKPAAQALARIQKNLRRRGMSLKVYDCYRPQTAVDYFVSWARDSSDAALKRQFYPHVPKDQLIPRGYIASPSSHSRGSTVDVTIVAKRGAQGAANSACGVIDPEALDMGTGWDCFDEAAHVDAAGLTDVERGNRKLLQQVFVRAGFEPYQGEWWHFTLKNEPHAKTYFDFPMK